MKALVSSLPLLVALASALTLTVGYSLLPTSQDSSSSLSARSEYCGNEPNTIAGTCVTNYYLTNTPSPFSDVHKSGDHYRLTFLSRFDGRSTDRTVKARVQPVPCPSCGIIWCQPGTETYLIIKTGWAATNVWFLRHLVGGALAATVHYITTGGDRVMSTSTGTTTFHSEEGLTLAVANANNHQMTWGVFSVALELLDNFIRENGGFASATFDVYDGRNQVATGKIQ